MVLYAYSEKNNKLEQFYNDPHQWLNTQNPSPRDCLPCMYNYITKQFHLHFVKFSINQMVCPIIEKMQCLTVYVYSRSWPQVFYNCIAVDSWSISY